MMNGISGLPGTSWMSGIGGLMGTSGTSDAFLRAMAGAWGASDASAMSETGRTAASSWTDPVSAWGHTSEVPGTTLEEMLRNVHPQLSYHVMDCSSSNWFRNDFPHYKLFQQSVNRYEIENWRPTGDEPTQANSPATHALTRVAPGSVAIVIHPAVQEKMDADPEYAREIFDRIEAWFAFDEARNAAIAAGHGDIGSGIEQRAVAIGEDGLITNALASSSGHITVSASGTSSSGRKELSPHEKRLLRHDQYMKEVVEEQIAHKALMSQQLTTMSLASSARQKVVTMMQDPALRTALGERVGRVSLDALFDITMQHIDNAAGLAV